MKRLVILFVLFQMSVLNAQTSEFNPQNFVGVIKYDDTKIIKAAKIKDADKISKLKKIVAYHNSDIDEVVMLNTEVLEQMKIYAKIKMDEAKISKDYSSMQEVKDHLEDNLFPIRNKIDDLELSLNSKFEALLSSKEYKKWLKYKKKEKQNLRPKPNYNKANNNSGPPRSPGAISRRGRY